MPRRDEKVSDPDLDDEDFPTLADDDPARRVQKLGAPPPVAPGEDDDEPTLDASAMRHPGKSPSSAFQVKNVPPARPPSVAGMRAVSSTVPKAADLGETVEFARSAFDPFAAKRQAAHDHESTQYLISPVAAPSTAVRAASPAVDPPIAQTLAEPVQSPLFAPPPPPPAQAPTPPKPPIALIVGAALVVALLAASVVYALTR